MKDNVAQVIIKTPIDLVIAGEALRNCWFRGQGSEKWGLTSTLERDADNFGVPRRFLIEREQTTLRLFKERAHIYIHNFEKPRSKFEWHSLIRHYGGPSRLFDVTSSYLVAAYFALCDSAPKQNGVIWAFKESYFSENNTNIDDLFEKQDKPEILIGKPEELNSRLHSQSGNFFVPACLLTSLEDQISEKFGTNLKDKYSKYRSVKMIETNINHKIWKLVFPRAVHSELFRFLSRCNVRGYSLFPGLEGLAMSLKEMMRAYE
ncbi:FRG domain-containing protein [Desulfofustis glycolicus]|uniref:FRG domain-containing protein n=1 Tax=Desulfofustis glycolicus DSM 9705 TaxID=1121409 RepID=A0A1M5VEJ5_9BACT|nr:FRG domain-containing protein [Desulfofustis glycolicus]SHH73611.1 FRG domain-containing protein [Desulfofustis glycolicus DSM 9705]